MIPVPWETFLMTYFKRKSLQTQSYIIIPVFSIVLYITDTVINLYGPDFQLKKIEVL